MCCSAGREEHGFDGVGEMAVHRRELELVLEVGNRTQAAHDGFETMLAGEIDREPVVAGDGYLGKVAQHFARELHALL